MILFFIQNINDGPCKKWPDQKQLAFQFDLILISSGIQVFVKFSVFLPELDVRGGKNVWMLTLWCSSIGGQATIHSTDEQIFFSPQMSSFEWGVFLIAGWLLILVEPRTDIFSNGYIHKFKRTHHVLFNLYDFYSGFHPNSIHIYSVTNNYSLNVKLSLVMNAESTRQRY